MTTAKAKPAGTSEYQMYRAEDADPPAIVCVVGTTELRYHLSRSKIFTRC